jgi:ABC-type polysaccharide/polyol phosphate transport system ATPase subunit
MTCSSDDQPVKVELSKVDVDLPILGSHNMNLKRRVAQSLARKSPEIEIVAALRDVTLKAKTGDRIGLVGHNGAGKTTLLRVVAGILSPTRGDVRISGSCVSMIDQSLGLDPQFTGMENIYRRGIFLNQDKESMAGRVEDIVEFSGLRDRIHHPLYTYSSGMRARLAFSIATSVEPEILVMDEGLGAADSEFNLRASKRFTELIGRAGILFLASHNRSMIDEYCNKTIELAGGRIVG